MQHLAAAYISSTFSGYPDLCLQFPWSAEPQRIGVCGVSTSLRTVKTIPSYDDASSAWFRMQGLEDAFKARNAYIPIIAHSRASPSFKTNSHPADFKTLDRTMVCRA